MVWGGYLLQQYWKELTGQENDHEDLAPCQGHIRGRDLDLVGRRKYGVAKETQVYEESDNDDWTISYSIDISEEKAPCVVFF